MNHSSRRSALKKIAGSAALFSVASTLTHRLSASDRALPINIKGKINHSVCKWCYDKIPLEDLCKSAKDIGLQSIELLGEKDWDILKKYDLTCAMGYAKDGGNLTEGFNNPKNHETLISGFTYSIPKAKSAGLNSLICFSGNRNGMSDELGMENCAKALQKIMPVAEKYKITIAMELLNSKVNHKDYMCDHTAWGAELCKMVGSENFKLLYDIYHMQIMEGDVIRTIKDNHQYIAHYHTGGVPGRNEIDESQELYYPAIMKAIAETGFKGFVAQEFIPKREDQIASLKQGVQICDVS